MKRDYVIKQSDLPNMSPKEQQGVMNAVRMGRARIDGAAVVRSRNTGNVRYDDEKLAGSYHEDKVR